MLYFLIFIREVLTPWRGWWGLDYRALTNGTPFGVPNPVIAVAMFAALAWVILNKTPLGEYFMAVGGNPEAARIGAAAMRRASLLGGGLSWAL